MKKIDKIVFKNFKAFNGEQVIDFNSKNLLLYGENGSGKSSIFWGIYTFLQSTTKKQDKIKDYFVQFDEANATTFSSLKNIYAAAQEEAYIEFQTKDNVIGNTVVDYIKYADSTTDIDKNNLLISVANSASDFINYKFLHNFYNVTHKQEINLWKVFEHDIFPFYRRTETDKYYQDEILAITKNVPRNTSTGRANRTDSWQFTQFNDKITDLNAKIDLFLIEIQNNANLFLKDYFFDSNDKIKLILEYKDKIEYDKIYNETHVYSIFMFIELFDEVNNRWIQIKRPQSFLNEAQLTRIAIAVRIGALQTRVTTSEYKILCLDDMLISLDMGNREKVIKTFLNTDKLTALNYFDEFQKVIFTHDRGFYNLCKQRIELDLDERDWVFKEMYFDSNCTPPKPYIADNSNDFKKAEKFLKAFDYPAAANSLRQGLEKVLRNILPKSNKYTIEKGVTEMKNLDGHLKAFEAILDKYAQNKSILNDLFIYKKHILNPFSHNNIDSPIFKEEIEKVLLTIPLLEEVKMTTLKEANQLINKGKFQDLHLTSGESYVFEFEYFEDIIKFKLLDGIEYLNITQCRLFNQKHLGMNSTVDQKFNSIKELSAHIGGILGKTYRSDVEIISKLRL